MKNQDPILSNSNDYILEVANLSKIYVTANRHFTALNNVSINFKRHENVAVIGHNGSGKTTLMEIITTVKNSSGGTIKYNFVNKNNDYKINMGIQFQETSFPSGFKVIDIINFYLEIFKSTWEKDELIEALKLFQLYDKLGQKITKLSSGQQQRLNIILSIIHNPELVILDEISTGLDILAKIKIKNFIKKLILERKLTLFLVSHNVEEVEQLCDRVVILHQGKIYYNDLLKNINKKYGSLSKLLDEYFQEVEMKNTTILNNNIKRGEDHEKTKH